MHLVNKHILFSSTYQ